MWGWGVDGASGWELVGVVGGAVEQLSPPGTINMKPAPTPHAWAATRFISAD